MPLTFPAHQGLIAPVKLAWPRGVDGTALCIGAASPDLAYSLGPWLSRQSHTAIGLLVWAIPVTVVAASVTRWRAAAGIFTAIGDLGPLRLRSFAVLGTRTPRPLQTVLSAALGAGSHVFVDGFTHAGRWGSTAVGFDRPVTVFGSLPIVGEPTVAKLLQYAGHGFGSLAFVGALLAIGRGRLLEDWYGGEPVAAARQRSITPTARIGFAAMALGPPLVAAVVAATSDRSIVFFPLTVLAASVLVAGVVTDPRRSVGSTAQAEVSTVPPDRQ